MRWSAGRPDTFAGRFEGETDPAVGEVVRTVALQAGFYLLGICAVCGLAAVPLAQFWFEKRIGIPGFAAAWAAISLAWALIPPRKRCEPPGAILDWSAAPRLHQLIEEVARELGISPPEETAIVSEANAMIVRRRAGFRRFHRLCLGLPLLHGLTVVELRAIVGHELGHLHHGDLRLGPWIYGSRQAIIRSLERMDRDGVGLHVLFNWYGRLYLRSSQAVSRRQELHADYLAARLCGRTAVVSALQNIEKLSFSWHSYWVRECVPVLEQGLRPPLLEGFHQYNSIDAIRDRLDRVALERSQNSDPYDSHPSLDERSAALAGLNGSPFWDSGGPALVLLEGSDSIEAALVRTMAISNRDFPTISWSQVGERVWLPRWLEAVQPYESILKTVGPGNMAIAIANLDDWAKKLRAPGPAILSPEATRQRALGLLGAWFAVILCSHRWDLQFAPGSEIRFTKDGHSVEPFTIVSDLREGRLTASQWNNLCLEMGLIATRFDHETATDQVR